MKYRELPASEVNDFKVGDWVRVYQNYGVGTEDYTIKEVHIDFISVKDITKPMYHWKACRKLVPVEPREWTITICEDGTLSKGTPFAKNIYNYSETIRVREVLE